MKNTFKRTLGAIALTTAWVASAQTALLNVSCDVSCDVSHEFSIDLNAAFVASYQKGTGKDIKVDQSHAGSSAQARAVADYVGSMAQAQKVHFADGGQLDKRHTAGK